MRRLGNEQRFVQSPKRKDYPVVLAMSANATNQHPHALRRGRMHENDHCPEMVVAPLVSAMNLHVSGTTAYCMSATCITPAGSEQGIAAHRSESGVASKQSTTLKNASYSRLLEMVVLYMYANTCTTTTWRFDLPAASNPVLQMASPVSQLRSVLHATK